MRCIYIATLNRLPLAILNNVPDTRSQFNYITFANGRIWTGVKNRARETEKKAELPSLFGNCLAVTLRSVLRSSGHCKTFNWLSVHIVRPFSPFIYIYIYTHDTYLYTYSRDNNVKVILHTSGGKSCAVKKSSLFVCASVYARWMWNCECI